MKAVDGGILKRNNIVSHGRMEKGRFKRAIKELSQFDNKMPREACRVGV